MKPHEETLAQSPTMPSEVVRREDGWTVGFARDGGMAQLWSAAPEMARALLQVRDVLQQHPGLRHDVDVALTKAGVLP